MELKLSKFWTVKVKRGHRSHFASDENGLPSLLTICGVDCRPDRRTSARKNVAIGSPDTCPRCLEKLGRLRVSVIETFALRLPRDQAEQKADELIGIERHDSNGDLILNLLIEGTSVRATERLTGVHGDTILRVLVAAGESAKTSWAA